MSHAATNWAFSQRGLKPASKLVLLVLADCHNPLHGCFPSQAFLAAECEMHRDTVNVHLAELEARRLISRSRSIDRVTKRQRSTRYKLAFEADFSDDKSDGETEADLVSEAPEAVSEIPTREAKAVSEFSAEPCRNYPESRVGNSDTNLVREPLREPVSETHVGGAEPEGFERFWLAFPRKRDRARCMELFQDAVKTGVAAERIALAAERYRAESAGSKPMYRACSDSWLERRRWEDYPSKVAPRARTEAVRDLALFWAGKLKAGGYVPQTAISPEVAACMLSNG
ncbi:helix-turn-helix domain-containing protein, partial [Falsigemmobacter faecalis]